MPDNKATKQIIPDMSEYPNVTTSCGRSLRLDG